MLVITRYPGEVVWIETADGPIKVEFLEHRTGGQIRLGFDAPASIRIYRQEVREGRGGALPRRSPALPAPDGQAVCTEPENARGAP